MPRNGGHPGVPFRHNGSTAKRRKKQAERPVKKIDDLWDDPETNGKAFFEMAEFREFLSKVSKAVVKEPRGYGTLKQKLGRVLGVPWPHEQWFAASLDILQDKHAIEYLNKKFKLKLKLIYRRDGLRDMFTTTAPPVKHTKYVQRSAAGTLEFI